MKNYIAALQFGRLVQKESWINEIFQKFSKLISELPYAKQAVFIYSVTDKICYDAFNQLALEIFLNYGEDTLSKALELFGKKEYRTGLPLLGEIYRPIQEAKKYMGRLQVQTVDDQILNMLESDYYTFMDIGTYTLIFINKKWKK